MAKKKTSEEKSDISDEELEEDLFNIDGEEPEQIAVEEQMEQEQIPFDEEQYVEEEEKKDFKYLKAQLIDTNNNIYRVEFKGASHGFLNYLSSKVLHVGGVNYSAYKETSLNPPVMTVVTDGSVPLKKVFGETCKIMKEEWALLKKTIQNSVK